MDAACTLMTTDWLPVLSKLEPCYQIRRHKRTYIGIYLGNYRVEKKMVEIEVAIWLGSIATWIKDLADDLIVFQQATEKLEYLKDVQRKYMLRHRWQLEQCCIAPPETIEQGLDDALPIATEDVKHSITFPKGSGPYGRDEWKFRELIKKAKQEAETVLQGWQAAAEARKLIPHRWFPTDIHEKVAIVPLQGLRELLMGLRTRAIRDEAFKKQGRGSADDVTPSEVWDKLKTAMDEGLKLLHPYFRGSRPHDDLPHDDLPHDDLPHDDLPHDDLPHDDVPNIPSSISEDKPEGKPEDKPEGKTEDKPEDKATPAWEKSGNRDRRKYEPAWRHPAVYHVCFLCGTTGETAEDVQVKGVRDCLRNLRDQRVPKDGWMKRASKDDQPHPEMNMRLHKAQAYTHDLKPVPGCDKCQTKRAYDELYTEGDKGTGHYSSNDSCAEHVCAQHCLLFRVLTLGPVEGNVVEAFFRSIDWSLEQGKE